MRYLAVIVLFVALIAGCMSSGQRTGEPEPYHKTGPTAIGDAPDQIRCTYCSFCHSVARWCGGEAPVYYENDPPWYWDTDGYYDGW